MKVRKLPNEVVGPVRKKRKRPEKRFGISVRYIGNRSGGWHPCRHDGNWHTSSWDWFVKESDRDHEMAKRARGWEKGSYEFRAEKR